MIRTLPNLERSIHKSNEWINDVNEELEWNDEQKSFKALEGTLWLLRDLLTVEEATDFGSQLPILIRGVYYTNWNPAKTPIRIDESTFVSRMHSHLDNDPDVVPDETVRRIFSFLSTKMTDGEIKDIKAQLPQDIEGLWVKPLTH